MDTAAPYSMTLRVVDDVIVVALAGPLDGRAAERVLDELQHLSEARRLPSALDLAGITYLDSAAGRALSLARHQVEAQRLPVRIASACPSVPQRAASIAGYRHVQPRSVRRSKGRSVERL
jgi:anti-anti-sigma factor